ncbi:OmpA family protein [Pontibacter pamirensis]|uniref:OmpA family protein n=1 Tax=Pontibacter pamirensis TaxID=2562824 RepID=UPI00138A47D7|nr:OmpA family protein [Pontibacter pamirensis]
MKNEYGKHNTFFQAVDPMINMFGVGPPIPLQCKGIGGPLDLQPDLCITAPGLGEVCGSGAAKPCSKMDLPGCGPVGKFFGCAKPNDPKTNCPPGWRAAGSKGFEDQCCFGSSVDNKEHCCPSNRISFLDLRCCKPDEVVAENHCKKMKELSPIGPLCFFPGKRSALGGKCCFLPEVPKGLGCGLPDIKPPVPKPQPIVPQAIEIFFDLDRPFSGETSATVNSAITAIGKNNFDKLVNALQDDPSLKVQLVGRTSPEGGAAYNRELGARRSRFIAAALKAAGIPGDRIADPPISNLFTGCIAIKTGLVSCGEEGATGMKDRQVLARVFNKTQY